MLLSPRRECLQSRSILGCCQGQEGRSVSLLHSHAKRCYFGAAGTAAPPLLRFWGASDAGRLETGCRFNPLDPSSGLEAQGSLLPQSSAPWKGSREDSCWLSGCGSALPSGRGESKVQQAGRPPLHAPKLPPLPPCIGGSSPPPRRLGMTSVPALGASWTRSWGSWWKSAPGTRNCQPASTCRPAVALPIAAVHMVREWTLPSAGFSPGVSRVLGKLLCRGQEGHPNLPEAPRTRLTLLRS